MDIQILKTKLYIPQGQLRERLVPRPRLIEFLNKGLRPGCRLVLVSAPAGFGKTTLLSEWIAQCTPDTHIAWLSLDGEDNDPARFLTYLATAMQTLEPGFAEDILALMQSPQPPDTEWMLTSLINDLTDHADPTVLVLDDYHEIVAANVHDALFFLLEHLPPHVHLVLSSRTDPPWPLARLRTREEMIELRAQDLRFSPEQALAFMNDAMALDLPVEDVAKLDTRTEGWIAGLQMAALSMQGRDATRTADFIRSFGGSNRFVLDYLVEEVLDRQDAEIRAFLLQTSILDRLTAPLCDAVLNAEEMDTSFSTDSRSILARLERANLFLVPLDDERRWYRYHHLFADLLRRQLEDSYPKQQIAESHGRASVWYESQGSIHEAVLHAVATENEDRVVYLVERYAGQALMRGEHLHVVRWLDALPEGVVQSRPLFCLARAWTSLGNPDTIDSAAIWMDRALELSAANPRLFRSPDGPHRTDHDVIRQNALLFRVNLATNQRADPEEIIDLCLEALEALPEQATFERGGVTFYLSQAYRHLNNRDAADRALAQAKKLGLATEGHSIAVVAAGMQAVDAWNRGDLNAVTSICQEAMSTLIRPIEQAGKRVHPHACLVYTFLGRALVERNALVEAEHLLIRGVELARQAGEVLTQVDGARDLARLYWVGRDFDSAHAWMDRAVQTCRSDPEYLHALRARIWLAQAEDDPRWLQEAVRWADGRALQDPGEYSWELQSLIRIRLAQYRARGAVALEPLLSVLDAHIEAPASTLSGWQVEVWTLKALLLHALGQTDEALSALARALAVARESGRVLAFLEHGPHMVELLRGTVRKELEASYARQILDAFETIPVLHKTPHTQASLVEPLSERELQVLRLLKSSLSQREMADQLVLSVNTIRSHVKSIYGKLGVHGRMEAVARAEELGLL